MQKILETYLNRLVNLSGNNRSLLLLRTTKSQDIDVNDLDYAINQSSYDIIKSFIELNKNTPLCKVIDPKDGNNNEWSKRLKTINRKEQFIFEERGAKDLYLGWPFVTGKFIDGTPVRCPLLFFPVELSIDSKSEWVLKKRKDVLSSFNKNFLLAYSYYNDVSFDDELANMSIDDLEADITVFITELYQMLKNSTINVNFNQELFKEKLKKLKAFKKDEYSDQFDIGELKLESQAVIGMFPQNSSYLFPDYKQMIEENKFSSIEEIFKSKKLELGQYKEESETKENSLYNAFPMDASQEAILKEVKKGKSLVVQGPPGTGKSQLICNFIADYISRGKKVLVVCQKRAALDVVNKRLSSKNISDFVGLVHDYKADRKNLYEQISKQVSSVEDYKLRNNGLDTIVLERTFQQTSNNITQICDEFDEFKSALFDTHECGVSIKELYLSSYPKEAVINLGSNYEHFVIQQLDNFKHKIKNYLLYAEKFENHNYILKNRNSFKKFSISDLGKFEDLISKIRSYQSYVLDKSKTLLLEPIDLEECAWVAEREDVFYNLIEELSEPEVYDAFIHYLNYNKVDFSRFNEIAERIYECYNDEEIELSLKSEELGKLAEVLQKAIQAKSNIIKWIGFNLSEDKYMLKRTLVANNLEYNRRNLKKLEKRLDNRLNLEHNFSLLQALGWIPEVPNARKIIKFKEWLILQKKGIKARERYETLRSFKNFFSFKNLTLDEYKKKVKNLFILTSDANKKYKNWQKYYNVYQINKILKNESFAKDLVKVINEDFESLCEFDTILDSLQDHELDIIRQLTDEVGYEEKKVIGLFENSVKLSWIKHIEEKYPILRKVSTKRFEQLEKDLQTNVEEKLDISSDILQLKAREITYKQIEYNRLKNPITYRSLEKQVNKKRKIWPLRKLVENCSEELFDLIPCWLTSPETASAIFPLKEDFDLVIFDEASQCFAENAIPAIVRGKQFIVVGDEKQLSPNDLYQVRWDSENEEDSIELDVESILDLASIYLPQKNLKQHYRSESLELMDFSNQKFYGSKLQILPHFDKIQSKEKSITFLKVNGIWEKNQNEIEAEKVVEQVIDLIKKKEKSIGVVTFNAKQQLLIQDKFEYACVQDKIVVPEDFFIKNIENVQGDEKDIIIFSITYAPTPSGKLSIQFGSLNMHKGENRLNVAITRARKKVIVVSSILPQELKVDNVKNDGPKLFKEYLQYALNTSEGNYKPTPYQLESALNKEYYLKSKLINASESYKDELPFADITEIENNRYKSIILTDDDAYYRQESAKETHCYAPIYLKEKKWSFTRMYSRLWWEGKQKF